MRAAATLLTLSLVAAGSVAFTAPAHAADPDSVVITPADGDIYVTVPAGVQAVEFAAQGGSGGDASLSGDGGLGALVGGAFYVTPGQQIRVAAGSAAIGSTPGWGMGDYIGGAPGAAGWNKDGEPVAAGAGGGASVILAADDTVLAIAGGGGGAGGAANADIPGPDHPGGGNGGSGGLVAGDGLPGNSIAGDGGDGHEGGAGGTGGIGDQGATGAAGAAAVASLGQVWGQGGGGGAGYVGGQGGGVASTSQPYASGGGGGGAGSSILGAATFHGSIGTALSSGDGSIQLFWISDLVVTPTTLSTPTTASDSAHPLTATIADSAGNPYPAAPDFLTWTSNVTSDTFSSSGVVMTRMGTHRISVAWEGIASPSWGFDVTVDPSTPTGVVIVDAPATAVSGQTVPFGVAAEDAFGNVWGDASADVLYTSDVSADVFGTDPPNEVTLNGVGTHVIAVSRTGLSTGTATIQVSAAAVEDSDRPAAQTPTGSGAGDAPGAENALAATGGSMPWLPLLLGATALGAGVLLRRRTARG